MNRILLLLFSSVFVFNLQAVPKSSNPPSHNSVKTDPVPGFAVSKDTACNGETIVFIDQSSGAVSSYNWNFGSGASPATATGPGPHFIKYSNSGFKKVNLTLNGTVSKIKDSAIYISSKAVPVAGFSINDSTQCFNNNSFIFTNKSTISSGSLTSNWYFGDGSVSLNTYSTSYSYLQRKKIRVKLEVISDYGCVDSISKQIYVFENARVSFKANDSDQCVRENLFSYTNTSALNSGTMTFFWDAGNGNFYTTKNIAVSYPAAGNYNVKLKVTTSDGCTDSLTKIIINYPMPLAKFDINDSAQCYPLNYYEFINISTVPSGYMTYKWDFADGNFSTAKHPQHAYSGTGFYDVKLVAISDKQCTDTVIRSVRVFDRPYADFTIDKDAQCLNVNNFKFKNNTVSFNSFYSTKYTFGDGSSINATSPKHSYTYEGDFKVKMIVVVYPGCEDSIIKTVHVNADPTASFIINNDIQCQKENNFTFTNLTTGINRQEWDYGNSIYDTTVNTAYHFDSYGVHTVKLVVYTPQGCYDTVAHAVT
ncbi:MAG: hypothetical protein H7321_00755, partial [Bacteroidia bacterium]|nr:hypothetical protein [Bacteroidia bacterium]